MLHGLTRDEALRRFCVLDAGGVIGATRRVVDRAAAPFRRHDVADGTDLVSAIEAFKARLSALRAVAVCAHISACLPSQQRFWACPRCAGCSAPRLYARWGGSTRAP